MPTGADLKVKVSVDGAREVEVELSRVDKAVDKTGKSADKSSKGMKNLKSGLAAVAPVALGAAGAAVALEAGITKTIGAAIDWESALAGVAKTLDTTGLSADEAAAEVERIGAELRQLAKEIPITATELAGVAEAAGQLGVAREDVVAFTETMAKLGVATNLTAEQAAVSFAQFANITGSTTADIDKLASSLVDLGNNSATTESDILNMATRMASAGTQAGFTADEILGMSAALLSVGVRAEAGGSAFSRVMIDMSKSVELADEKLAIFAEVAGQSAQEFADTWDSSPREALIAFIEGLAEVEASGGSTALILDELGLDGIRVGNALRASATAGDLMRESMDRANVAFGENVALNKEAEQRFATTESQIQLLKNALTDVAISFGELLTPAIVTGATTLREDFLPMMEDAITIMSAAKVSAENLAEAFLGIDEGAAKTGITLFKWTTIFGPLEFGLKKVANDAQEFADATERLKDRLNEQRAELDKTSPQWQHYINLLNDGFTEEANAYAQKLLMNEGLADQAELAYETSDALGNLTSSTIDYNAEIVKFNMLAEEWKKRGQEVADVEPIDDAKIQRAKEMQDTQDALAITYGQVGNVVEEYAAKLDRSRQRTDEATESTNALTQATLLRNDTQTKANQIVDNAAAAIGHWEGELDEIAQAMEYNDQLLADGTITVAEHTRNTEILTTAEQRRKDGINNDLIPAFVDSVVLQEELQGQLEALKIAYDNNEISAEEFAAAEEEINKQLTAAAAEGGPFAMLISKLDELITALLEADSVDPNITATGDFSDAWAELNAFRAAVQAGSIFPVSMVTGTASGGTAYAEGGPVKQSGMALVGERGPEIVFLPGGSHVLSNENSKRFLGGFADGTFNFMPPIMPAGDGGVRTGRLPGGGGARTGKGPVGIPQGGGGGARTGKGAGSASIAFPGVAVLPFPGTGPSAVNTVGPSTSEVVVPSTGSDFADAGAQIGSEVVTGIIEAFRVNAAAIGRAIGEVIAGGITSVEPHLIDKAQIVGHDIIEDGFVPGVLDVLPAYEDSIQGAVIEHVLAPAAQAISDFL